MEKKQQIKVLLADDNELFREGLALLLESQPNISVICQCNNGADVLEKTRETRPDLMLLKIRLPGYNGIEVTKSIKASMPDSNVVILTDSEEEEDLFNALKAGAKGYLLKSTSVEDLTKSVELLAKGKFIVSDRLAQKLINEFTSMKDDRDQKKLLKAEIEVELSEREREIVKLVAMGATNKEIAGTLVIAENTAKVHIKNILEKLQLRNKQQLAAYAVEHQWTTDKVDLEKVCKD